MRVGISKLKHTNCCLYLCLVILTYSCGASSEKSKSTSPGEARQPAENPQSVNEKSLEKGPEQDLFDQWVEGVPSGLQEGWQRLTGSGQYRLAQESDFRFPEAAKRDVRRLNWLKHPYFRILFHTKEDSDLNSFLAVVVDSTRTDDARFALVILDSTAGGSYEVHWVFRDRDLSRSLATTASSNLFIETYNEDGSSAVCAVEWDKQRQSYLCK